MSKRAAGLVLLLALGGVVLGVTLARSGALRNSIWLPRSGDRVCTQEQPSSDPIAANPREFVALDAKLVVDGLDQPTDVMQLPGWNLLLVAEKPGRIVAIADGEILETPVLDITDGVSSDWNERGLLTMVAHPNFASTCELFLFYTDLEGHSNLVSVIVAGTEVPRVDPASSRLVLFVPQSHQYHQSGSMAFGPEGHLWVSIGDGGGRRAQWNSQNALSLKGSVLRLDVGDRPYGIPNDNPYVANNRGAPQVWAIGVRNPWRLSIDAETGLLYLPDAGHHLWEELNIVPIASSGWNFGWPLTEGASCNQSDVCDTSGLTSPVLVYQHEDIGCAIVGGQVYRGRSIPEINGHYFYADFCRGWIKSFVYKDGNVTGEADWTSSLDKGSLLTSFGSDANGELYYTNLDGELWKIVAVRD